MSVSRRLAPSTRSSARAASSRAAPSASSAARTARSAGGERVLGLGQTVGGGAAGGFGGLRPRRSARGASPRRSPARRRATRARCLASALRVSSVAIWAAARSLRSLQACRSVPMAVSRRSASSASRASACASARTSASCARLPSISARMSASWRFQLGGRRQLGERAVRRVAAGLRPRRGRRSAGSWPRSARRCARCCAPSRARPWRAVRARCRPRAAPRASARARAASAAPAAVSVGLRRLGGLALVVERRARAATSSASMSERRLRCGEPARRAGRRMGGGGKAVPAPEIAVARDQPLAGLEQAGEPRAIGALDHADLRETARQLRRRLHVLGERLARRPAAPDRTDRPRRPSSAWRGTGRPARRDRRRARRRARSRSPSRR